MRRPYPVDIVPLLPQFLTRRRAKLDFPLRAAEELGIDRPAFQLAMALELVGPSGISERELAGPYATKHDQWSAAAAAAAGAGLAEQADGRWRMTERGHQTAKRLRAAAHAHLALLDVLPADELRRLADLLERAFQAVARAPEPAVRERTPRAFRFRAEVPPPSPLVALENAIQGLWTVRDDCHIAAWRAEGIDGPTLDVLTRIWRREAPTIAELAPRLAHGRPEDVAAAIGRLREGGRVAPGEPLALTDEGSRFRQRIEDETDRLFFTPWPDDVGAQAAWIEERLRAVNEKLA